MRFIPALLFGAALMLCGSPGRAQVYRAGPNDAEQHRRHDAQVHGYYGYGNNAAFLIDRVSSNLSNAARANPYVNGHERDHFQTAQRELQKFQQRWAQGQFDTGPLDKAISSIQDLANGAQLSPRDRSVLANDLSALRDFRANRGVTGGAMVGMGGVAARMVHMGLATGTVPVP